MALSIKSKTIENIFYGSHFEVNARDLPLSLFSEKKVMHARLYDEAWFGSVGLLAQFEVDLLIGVEREGQNYRIEFDCPASII